MTTAINLAPPLPSLRSTAVRTVVAVGPHLLCDAFVARLSSEEDIYAIAAPGNAKMIGQAVLDLAPEVLVLDPKAAGDTDLVLLGKNAGPHRHLPVVVLVSTGDRSEAARMIRAGASAVVLKSAPTEELVSAIHWTANGAGWISPPLLRGVLEELHRGSGRTDSRLRLLTPREREIVQLMVDGFGRKQIAEQLYLSVDTVRTHLRTIMEKLNAHSATAAVSVALSAGLRPRK